MQNFKNSKLKVKKINKVEKKVTNLNFLTYQKPQVFSEEIMGMAALACGKCVTAGLKTRSFTCKQLPSGS